MIEQGLGNNLGRLFANRSIAECMENTFGIHDCVEWDVGGKNPRIERGVIEIIVPPRENPRRLMTKRWGTSKKLWTGKSHNVVNYYTYVIEQHVGTRVIYKLIDINRLRAVK